ncbi:MAG: NeuD/PglB/VioB family sugar acetyltransferase [Pseudomonadota bacterium]
MTMRPLPAVVASADKDFLDLVLADQRWHVVGVFDPKPGIGPACGVPILGADEAWSEWKRKMPELRVFLVVDVPARRRRLIDNYGLDNLETLVAPDAYLSASARIGKGSIIQRRATILSDVAVGKACKINVGASIHHDCALGDCCTLGPGCRLLGAVALDDEVYVGAGAVILQRVRIGRGAVVGAGAVVVRDVAPGATVAGSPARALDSAARSARP